MKKESYAHETIGYERWIVVKFGLFPDLWIYFFSFSHFYASHAKYLNFTIERSHVHRSVPDALRPHITGNPTLMADSYLTLVFTLYDLFVLVPQYRFKVLKVCVLSKLRHMTVAACY